MGPDCNKSRPLPCGTPSITSTKTTSASSFSAMRSPQLAPTLPAPTTVTFFRKREAPLGDWKDDYNNRGDFSRLEDWMTFGSQADSLPYCHALAFSPTASIVSKCGGSVSR